MIRTIPIQSIISILSKFRFDLHQEVSVQGQIAVVFAKNNIPYKKEYSLDEKNRPDFFLDGIAIEVKIKGSARSIYKQVERYSKFEEVKELILITNRSMGFPNEINGKPCYLISLGKAWL